MFEYFAYAFNSIDILGMGAYPLLLSISIGLAILISQKRTGEFLLILSILNLMAGLTVFIGNSNWKALFATGIVALVIILLPGRTEDANIQAK